MLRSIVVLLCCAGCGAAVEKRVETPKPEKIPDNTLSANFSFTSRTEFVVTITNNSAKPVVICPLEHFIVCYHESTTGQKTAISWDASNADALLLTGFQTVLLQPGSLYRTPGKLWIDNSRDQSRFLNVPGKVYVEVLPLRLGNIDDKFRAIAEKSPLLKTALRTNELETPLSLR